MEETKNVNQNVEMSNEEVVNPPKSLKDLLNDDKNVVSIVMKADVEKKPEEIKRMIDYLANFVTIFDYQLLGIDNDTMKKIAPIIKEHAQKELENKLKK